MYANRWHCHTHFGLFSKIVLTSGDTSKHFDNNAPQEIVTGSLKCAVLNVNTAVHISPDLFSWGFPFPLFEWQLLHCIFNQSRNCSSSSLVHTLCLAGVGFLEEERDGEGV